MLKTSQLHNKPLYHTKFTLTTTRITTITPKHHRSSPHQATTTCQAQPGDKILPLLRTPFDLLALGPRVALGSLNSINETLAQLPADVEKIAAFVADPRPLDQKQAELLEEIETRVVTYVEKGTAIEVEIINSIPEPLKDALPQQLKDALLAPRPTGTANDYATDTDVVSTWSISSMDEMDNGTKRFPSSMNGTGVLNDDDEDLGEGALNEVPGAALAANQVAAELVEIQTAVVAVKDALTALKTNAEPSKEGMLRLNLREASQGLQGRLQQTRPGSRSSDAAVDQAVEEAEALLGEVNALV